jgi:hypothetical protein
MTGCPRFAEVEMFNYSEASVHIVLGGIESPLIAPGASYRFRFSAEEFSIVSAGERWDYARRIPHGGEDGTFFDGRLRIQLEADGRLFVLKKEEAFPIAAPSTQPEGFPLHPKSPSRASQTTSGRRPVVADC